MKWENEQLDSAEIAARAERIFREILPEGQGSFAMGYMTADYTDDQHRWVEARLIQDPDDPTFFTLNANIGNALALVELKEKLKAKGLIVKRLVAHDTDRTTQRALKAAGE